VTTVSAISLASLFLLLFSILGTWQHQQLVENISTQIFSGRNPTLSFSWLSFDVWWNDIRALPSRYGGVSVVAVAASRTRVFLLTQLTFPSIV
jgi:hypothetical protein